MCDLAVKLSTVAGFTRHAATSASGYSHMLAKIRRASSALNAPPKTPPKGKEEVELRQPRGERASLRQLAVTDHAYDKEQPTCNVSINRGGLQ